jgi:hypothetical protein
MPLWIDKSAHTGGNAVLENGARIGMNLIAAGTITKGANTSVGGTKIERAPSPPRTTAPLIVLPPCTVAAPGGPDLTIPANSGTRKIAPGDHGNFKFGNGNTVVLKRGTYSFQSLSFGTKTRINIEGPVTIHVKQRMIFGNGVKQVLKAGSADEVVYFLDSGASANVGVKNKVFGTFCGPQAEVSIGNGSLLEGAVYANKVTLGKNATIISSPASTSQCQTKDDGSGGQSGQSCGPAQVCNAAGQCRAATLIATPLGPTAIEAIPDYDPGTLGCGPGLDLGPLVDAGGQPAYTSITYPKGPVDPRPGPNCREAIQFCDDDENPIPAPTEAELSEPPPQTVLCPPLSGPSLDQCTIDPTTISHACTIDADCAEGEVCGVLCTSPDCSTADRLCGRLYASCAGMPDVGEACDPRVFRICADRNKVVTVTEAEAEQQVPQESEPQPGVTIPEDERFEVPPYESVSQFLNVACLDTEGPKKELKQEKAPLLQLGNKDWGLFVDTFFENRTRLSFFKAIVLANEQIEIGGGGGLKAGANVLGQKITAVDGALNVALGECQQAIGFELKIFGEAVAALDTVDGTRSKFDTLIPSGRGLETPPAAKDDCIAKFKNRNQEASLLRKSMFIARNVRDFSLKNGVSEDLCKRTNTELGTDFECKIDNIDIPNAWKVEYDKAVEKYKETKTDFDLSRGKVAVDAQINLFDLRHRYQTELPEVRIPVGPVQIQLALNAFGTWHFSGFIQVGLRYDGEFRNLVKESLLPFATLFTPPASVRAIAGPVIDPGVEVGVVAFAGVGIPGVAIGLEGSVTVLGLSVPIDARAAAVRRLETDTRDLAGTDYAGPLIKGLEPQVYHWFYGGAYGGKLVLKPVLQGDLDAVARVRVFFVRKTFRKRLARLKGFTKTLVAVGDEFGEPLREREDFGPFADEFAFSGVTPLAVGEIPANSNSSAIYPGTLERDKACIEGDLVPVPARLPPVPLNFCKGPPFSLVATIGNQGDTDAPASITKIEFISPTTSALLPTPPIVAGGAVDLPPIGLPNCLTCDFTITADFGNQLTESNEANNSADGRCIIVE